jgi:hypothetical protein
MNNPENHINAKQHPVKLAAKRLGNLAYECRLKGYSLRLLAALMDTKFYGIVYQSMISAERGRGGRRGPTLKILTKALHELAPHLLNAMENRKITPRRWCTAYSVDLEALLDPVAYEMNTNEPVLEFLQEDFPEAFGLERVPYLHAYKKMPGFGHMHVKNKGIHIYETYDGIRVVNHQKGDALKSACQVQGFTIQTQRLQVLLDSGADEALAWVPVEPLIDYSPQSEAELNLLASLMKSEAEDELFDEIMKVNKYLIMDTDKIKIERCIFILKSEFNWSDEQIENRLKTLRYKKRLY